MFRTTFSAGSPSRSYMASRNAGSMMVIIKSMAPVLLIAERVSK